MTLRIFLLIAAAALATPAIAGGHPNGKPKEFYATQRQPGKAANTDTTASVTPACKGKTCQHR